MPRSSERRRPQPFRRFGPHAGSIITLVVILGSLAGSLLFGNAGPDKADPEPRWRRCRRW